MRRVRACGFWLLMFVLIGCTTAKSTRSTSWLERFSPFQVPNGPDVVQMDVALLERPVGDSFITSELWNCVDEQAVPLERKALLEENGLRVGRIGGIPPAGLLTLLTSEPSCPNPRRLYLRAGNPTSLVLGPAAALCQFEIEQAAQPAPIALTQAECSFDIVPGLTKDGRTRLQFTPLIHHGEKTLGPRTAPDGSGILLTQERPSQAYSNLSWEVTLAANQYLVIGARGDRPDSLGCRFFVRSDETVPVQRLLVIRASRTSPLEREDDLPLGHTPPLVLQAAWTKARGSCP